MTAAQKRAARIRSRVLEKQGSRMALVSGVKAEAPADGPADVSTDERRQAKLRAARARRAAFKKRLKSGSSGAEAAAEAPAPAPAPAPATDGESAEETSPAGGEAAAGSGAAAVLAAEPAPATGGDGTSAAAPPAPREAPSSVPGPADDPLGFRASMKVLSGKGKGSARQRFKAASRSDKPTLVKALVSEAEADSEEIAVTKAALARGGAAARLPNAEALLAGLAFCLLGLAWGLLIAPPGALDAGAAPLSFLGLGSAGPSAHDALPRHMRDMMAFKAELQAEADGGGAAAATLEDEFAEETFEAPRAPLPSFGAALPQWAQSAALSLLQGPPLVLLYLLLRVGAGQALPSAQAEGGATAMLFGALGGLYTGFKLFLVALNEVGLMLTAFLLGAAAAALLRPAAA